VDHSKDCGPENRFGRLLHDWGSTGGHASRTPRTSRAAMTR